MVGHYTQVVWANTEFVGCAVSTHGSYKVCLKAITLRKKDDKSILQFLVCNYGRGGNIRSDTGASPIYKIGKPGSECPDGYAEQNGLCGRCAEHQVLMYHTRDKNCVCVHG